MGVNLELDLSNPAEISARLPEIQLLYEEKREEKRMLDEQVEFLRRLIVGAAGISRVPGGRGAVEEPPRRQQRRRTAPAQDRAIKGLNALYAKSGSAAGPTSLYKFMVENGMDVPKDANVLGVNLYNAWEARRVMRAPNGVYTPLDGTGRVVWPHPLTDYYYAAELGFPTP